MPAVAAAFTHLCGECTAPKVADEVTLFDKIVAGDIPCDKIYEDDVVRTISVGCGAAGPSS